MQQLPTIPEAQATVASPVPGSRRSGAKDVELWQEELAASAAGALGVPGETPSSKPDASTEQAPPAPRLVTIPSQPAIDLPSSLPLDLPAHSTDLRLALVSAARSAGSALQAVAAEFLKIASPSAAIPEPGLEGATPDAVAQLPEAPDSGTAAAQLRATLAAGRTPTPPATALPGDPLPEVEASLGPSVEGRTPATERTNGVASDESARQSDGSIPVRSTESRIEPELPKWGTDLKSVPLSSITLGSVRLDRAAAGQGTEDPIESVGEPLPAEGDENPETGFFQRAPVESRETPDDTVVRESALSTVRADLDEAIRTRGRREERRESDAPETRVPRLSRSVLSRGVEMSAEAQDFREVRAIPPRIDVSQLRAANPAHESRAPQESPEQPAPPSTTDAPVPSAASSENTTSETPLPSAATALGTTAPRPVAPHAVDSGIGSHSTSTRTPEAPVEIPRIHHSALAESIVARARALPSNGALEVRFALEPEHLGAVRVRIESHGGELKIRILASSGAAVEALSAGLARLATGLTEPGARAPQIDLRFDDSMNPGMPQSRGDSGPREHSRHDDRDVRREAYRGIEPALQATTPRTSRLDCTA